MQALPSGLRIWLLWAAAALAAAIISGVLRTLIDALLRPTYEVAGVLTNPLLVLFLTIVGVLPAAIVTGLIEWAVLRLLFPSLRWADWLLFTVAAYFTGAILNVIVLYFALTVLYTGLSSLDLGLGSTLFLASMHALSAGLGAVWQVIVLRRFGQGSWLWPLAVGIGAFLSQVISYAVTAALSGRADVSGQVVVHMAVNFLIIVPITSALTAAVLIYIARTGRAATPPR